MEFAKKIKGVSYDTKNQKYRAYITFKKNRISLGYYKDISEAIQKRKIAESLIKENMKDDVYFLIKLWRRLKVQNSNEAILNKVKEEDTNLEVFLMMSIIDAYCKKEKTNHYSQWLWVIIKRYISNDPHHSPLPPKFNYSEGEIISITLKNENFSKNSNFACFVFDFLNANYDTLEDLYNVLLKKDEAFFQDELYVKNHCFSKPYAAYLDFLNTSIHEDFSRYSLAFISGESVASISKSNSISKSVIYRKINEDFERILKNVVVDFI